MPEGSIAAGSLGRQLISPLTTTIVAVLPSFLVGALAVQIRGELELSEVRLGLLVTIFAVTGFLASPFLGRLIESRGERGGTLVSASLVAVGLAIAAFAPSWSLLAVAYVIAGIGNAAAHPTANLMIAGRVPSERQGVAFGIKQAAIPIAIFLSGVAVPVIGLTVGWRWAYVGAALCAVGMVLYGTRLPPRTATSVSVRGVVDDIGPLLLVAVVGFLAIAGVQAVATFLVLAAVDQGIGSGAAGLLLAAASVIGIAVRISSGWLVDRVPGSRVLLIIASYMAIGAIGLAVISFAGSFTALALGTLLGLGAGWSWNGMMHFVVVRGFPESPAAASSILQAGLLGGVAVGPLVFGWIVTTLEFRSAWLVAGASLMMAGLLSVFAWRVWLPRQMAADDRRTRHRASGVAQPEGSS